MSNLLLKFLDFRNQLTREHLCVNKHLTIIDIHQYPLLSGADGIELSGSEEIKQYDRNADPIKTRQTDIYGAFCAS